MGPCGSEEALTRFLLRLLGSSCASPFRGIILSFEILVFLLECHLQLCLFPWPDHFLVMPYLQL